uniref:Uncharacterized protein n=1 Tax=Anguilla anguilla TaxID=7936 RepID=A0A0E9W0C0_ANGAN
MHVIPPSCLDYQCPVHPKLIG